MKKKFYKHYCEFKSQLFFKDLDDVWNKLDTAPRLFATTEEPSEFKSIFGQNLKQFELKSIRHARDFLRDMDGSKEHLYGLSKFAASIIADSNFEHSKPSDFKIGYFDIETEVGDKFPDPIDAEQQINMITFIDNKSDRAICFTTCDIDLEQLDEDAEVKMFDTEEEMLLEFCCWFEAQSFDIISGWFSEGFDIPYIVNRIKKIISSSAVERMSPFNEIKSNKFLGKFGDERISYRFTGLVHLDMKDVYAHLTFTPRSSYSLDFIANAELGVGKLVHESGIPGHLLYRTDPTAGLKYNIIDVRRVKEIDTATALTDRVITVSQMSNSNADDAAFVTRIILNTAYDFLSKKNTFMPLEYNGTDGHVVGGYVKQPILGLHQNVASFDIASLYPSIMRAFNISPETMGPFIKNISSESFLNGGYKHLDKDLVMCANGQTFVKDRRGFFPEMLDFLYEERKKAKKKSLEYNQKYEDNPTAENKMLKEQWWNRDISYKVILNSCYGSLASKRFLFFDKHLAEAVTMTGHLIVKRMGQALIKQTSKQQNVELLIDRFEDIYNDG